MKRDQVVGIAAAILAAVSAALPWIKSATLLYETGGKSSLGAFSVPVTFVISGPTSSPGGSTPAIAVVVAVVALGLLVWTFLPRTPRRVLYIVWGLIAMAAPVLLYLELQKDIDAKNLSATVFTLYGLGPFFLVGGGILAIVAGIIGAGSKAEVATAAGVPSQGGPAPSPYGAPGQYGVPPQAQPAAGTYGAGDQTWAQTPDPYPTPQQPAQPAPAYTGQDWGAPQAPPQPQPWGAPAAPQAPAAQPWDQPPSQAQPQEWDPTASPAPPQPPPQAP